MSNNNHFYNNTNSRINTLAGGKYSYWVQLRKARSEFINEEELDVPESTVAAALDHSRRFSAWMRDRYGVGIVMDNLGNITGNYEIVDEAKYLLFVLKYPE